MDRWTGQKEVRKDAHDRTAETLEVTYRTSHTGRNLQATFWDPPPLEYSQVYQYFPPLQENYNLLESSPLKRCVSRTFKLCLNVSGAFKFWKA